MTLVNAVAIIDARWSALTADTYAAITEARAAGTSEFRAMLTNVAERKRLASILPRTPDNDRINDRLRQLHGEPSQLMCDVTERERRQ